jgi:hypothetical protein
MTYTDLAFGTEADWALLDDALEWGAEEADLETCVQALERLAQAGATAELPPAPAEIGMLVLTALRLDASAPEASVQALGALAPLDATLRREAASVADETAAQLGAFRYAAGAWDRLCAELEDLQPAPAHVQEAAQVYLEALAALRDALLVVEGWEHAGTAWAGPLRERLDAVARDAEQRLLSSAASRHLWTLAGSAEAYGLEALLPALTDLLALEGAQEAATPPGDRTEPAPAECRLREVAPEVSVRRANESLSELGKLFLSRPDAERRIAELALAVEQGRIGEKDFEAFRAAALQGKDRGVWLKAHREAIARNGFTALVHLVRTETGAFSAPTPLRVAPALLDAELRQLEASRRTLLPSDEARPLVDSAAGAPTAIEPTGLPAPAAAPAVAAVAAELPEARFALAARRMHVVQHQLLLFGDAEGLWCHAWNELEPDSRVTERCQSRSEGLATEVRFPLSDLGEDGLQLRSLRLGPLRELVEPWDRLYSPRAFVVTVGESSLRNLLGWSIRDCGAQLAARAQAAGIQSGSELLERISSDVLWSEAWISDLPLSEPLVERLGMRTLGELRRDWARLAPAEHGAEVDTLDALLGDKDLAPSDADHFVLVTTRTATSVLAGRLVADALRVKFPHSEFRLVACQTMRQREELEAAARADVPLDPLGEAYRTLEAVLRDTLDRLAADPVLVISGGTKWEAAAGLMAGRDAMVPCVYKFEPAASAAQMPPAVLRWEWLAHEPDAFRHDPPPDVRTNAEDRRLVMSVGTSLLGLYRRVTGDKNALPDHHTLAGWADQRGADLWRTCAELTGFEAWWNRLSERERSGTVHVALVASRSPEGQVCARAVTKILLQRQDTNLYVHSLPSWEVHAIGRAVQGEGPARSSLHQIFNEIWRPLHACFDDVAAFSSGPLDVIAMGGQKLTAALLLLSAPEGARVYLAPEAEKTDERPALWPVHDPRTVNIEKGFYFLGEKVPQESVA